MELLSMALGLMELHHSQLFCTVLCYSTPIACSCLLYSTTGHLDRRPDCDRNCDFLALEPVWACEAFYGPIVDMIALRQWY